MKLTAKVKLQPTPDQSALLTATLERANAACNALCIAKVSDALAKDRKRPRRFKPHGAFPYDARILSWRTEDRATAAVSIWTAAGRLLIPTMQYGVGADANTRPRTACGGLRS